MRVSICEYTYLANPSPFPADVCMCLSNRAVFASTLATPRASFESLALVSGIPTCAFLDVTRHASDGLTCWLGSSSQHSMVAVGSCTFLNMSSLVVGSSEYLTLGLAAILCRACLGFVAYPAVVTTKTYVHPRRHHALLHCGC